MVCYIYIMLLSREFVDSHKTSLLHHIHITQPFFSGLDWGKLELKEIQPPEDFSVENDEDLRHFHDE